MAKWLEAVAFSLSYEKNDELEKCADAAIDLIGKAQEENADLICEVFHTERYKNAVPGHEEIVMENGYLALDVLLKDEANSDAHEMLIDVRFDMPAQLVFANPLARANVGKVAVVKGPVVYCLEQVDNGKNLAGLYIDTTKELEEMFDPDILGGVTVVKAKGKRVIMDDWNDGKLYAPRPVRFEEADLTFVPYCNWGNRGYGEMSVWVKTL